VNPREERVQGVKSYPSILAVPGEVDLAVIAVPAPFVKGVLEECGRKGVKGVVMITAGFRETGREEDRRLEEEVVEIVRRHRMRLIGPNTLGVVNTYSNLNACILTRMPPRGGISFITQSGTLGLALAEWTVEMGLGLNIIVSTGNKADVDDVELLEYLAGDENTRVIAIYLEGLERGRDFIELARGIGKPIVVIKTGRSRKGRRAVFSHTGSLAGSDEVYSAAFCQAGIVRMDTIEGVFDAALAFSTQPLPQGRRVGIVSCGGGASILAADACERYGLEVVDLEPETIEKIQGVLPSYASPRNPVDTVGLTSYEVYWKTIEALLQDRNVDALLVIYVHSAIGDAVVPAKALADVMERGCGKPVLCCWIGGRGTEKGVEFLHQHGMPNYPTPNRCARALAALAEHQSYLEKTKTKVKVRFEPEKETTPPHLGEGEEEIAGFLRGYGIPVVETRLARSPGEASGIAGEIGFPVALKISSPDISHKTDVGGVVLNLDTPGAVETAYQEIIENTRRKLPDASIRGVLVQKMAEPGLETIVGLKHDPQFGGVVMFGIGGILVETYRDISLRVTPLSRREAEEMLEEIKGSPLLAGIRGGEPRDKKAIVDTILAVSKIAETERITELDINPLIVYQRGALAVDFRIKT